MQNEITWLVDNQVIMNKVYSWDLTSLEEHSVQTRSMVMQSDHPIVHTIWDFTEMTKYPKNVKAVGQAVKPLLSSEKLGWVITIMDNPMITFLSTVATGFYRVRFRSFKTREDAIGFLQSQDSSLPDMV